jgi:hypothetical protein
LPTIKRAESERVVSIAPETVAKIVEAIEAHGL